MDDRSREGIINEALVFLMWLGSFPLFAVLTVAWELAARRSWLCHMIRFSFRRVEELPRCAGSTAVAWWAVPVGAWTVVMVAVGFVVVRRRRRQMDQKAKASAG